MEPSCVFTGGVGIPLSFLVYWSQRVKPGRLARAKEDGKSLNSCSNGRRW